MDSCRGRSCFQVPTEDVVGSEERAEVLKLEDEVIPVYRMELQDQT